MAQYTINARHGSVFGMDVHARSVVVRGLDRTTGEERSKRFIDCPTGDEIATWMTDNLTGPHYAAYESGCTGFHLCRQLRAAGIESDVIAVSSIARSTDDRQQKTDKRDARRLLSELLNPLPTYTTVWMPGEDIEAARDLARMRSDVAGDLRRSKQQVNALLLLHGCVWNEKTITGKRKRTWGREHWAWLEHITFDQLASNLTLAFALERVRDNTRRIDELNKMVAAQAALPRFKPYVDALMLIKGIDTQTAFLLVAEVGDFGRFRRGRSASKWLGTCPKENTSDENVRHGHITKAGNAHARSALIEAASTISSHTAKPKSASLGHEVTPAVASLCAQANKRLKARYVHLIHDGHKNTNKAKVAVANEMIRWVVVIGQAIDRELAEQAAAM